MKISKKDFGIHNGQAVTEYTLDNGKNLVVKILNLGGVIREINFKGKNRVLGFDNVEDYINKRGSIGALIGRVAGRISKGRMEIDGEVYELDKNEGTSCLHGGEENFSKKLWTLVEEEVGEEQACISLKYKSADGEAGFPGELDVLVKYIIDKDDSLTIEYFAKTNKPTIITLTNHSYFNLNDSLEEDILDHRLRIDADQYIRLDDRSIPIEISKVKGTPFDFREAKAIRKDLDLGHKDLKNPLGYDHPFILNKEQEGEILLSSPSSGVSLLVETTEPAVILYCSNKLEEGMKLSGGEETFRYQGVCLETQWYPDAINQEFLPKNILRPDENYYSRTSYRFV